MYRKAGQNMQKIILEIQGKDINIHKASRFHGWLMEQVDEAYALRLHTEPLRPFSQYLYGNGEKWEWHIHTLTSEADEKIGNLILQKKEILLESSNTPIRILEKKWEEESIDDLLKKTYFTDSPDICTVEFLTPTSFKRQGKYLIFPDVKLIFQSLLQKFAACGYEVSFGDGDILAEIQNKVEIIDYRLRTKKFYLEGTGIKGFQGNIRFKIYGSQAFINMVNFLLHFGGYAGIGIKTALGMGAAQISERR